MYVMSFKTLIADLEASLRDLSDRLITAGPIRVSDVAGPFKTGSEGAALAAHHLSNLYYGDHKQDGRLTPVCIGAIEADAGLIEQVRRINLLKDELHKAASDLADNIASQPKGPSSSAGIHKHMRSILADIGYARLSLRLCNRHIPIIDYSPKSIRFSFSGGGKSIRKVSVEKALRLVQKLGADSVSAHIDAERLSRLQPDTPLAQVQQLASYYKANVVSRSDEPATIPVFLPLFYLGSEGEGPEFPSALVGEGSTPKRKPRSDQKLEATPLASSVRVYAYKC